MPHLIIITAGINCILPAFILFREGFGLRFCVLLISTILGLLYHINHEKKDFIWLADHLFALIWAGIEIYHGHKIGRFLNACMLNFATLILYNTTYVMASVLTYNYYHSIWHLWFFAKTLLFL